MARALAPRYRFGLIPRPDRFPKRGRDWTRSALVLAVVLALVAGILWRGSWLTERVSCRPGVLPAGDVWSEDGECVGVSDGSYDFGLPRFASTLARIAAANRAAGKDPCGNGAAPVTIGVVMTMTSVNARGRAEHELRGFAAQQALANQDCTRPVRLLVGQVGAGAQASVPVALRLARDPDVVGLVGMGLSDSLSADAVNAVAASSRPVPMVADLITAQGFDREGSQSDDSRFSRCAAGKKSYESGIGGDYFYRVAYRLGVQVDQLAGYAKAVRSSNPAVDFVITPSNRSDPLPCTEFELWTRAFPRSKQINFQQDEPSTVRAAADQICLRPGDQVVAYAARARDLARLITVIDRRRQDGVCTPDSVTLEASSDASRIRIPDPDASAESVRTQALTSDSFRSGYVRLLTLPLANRDLVAGSPRFTALSQAFSALGFADADLDDGWAINAYDALATLTGAVADIPVRDGGTVRPVGPDEVNAEIGTYTDPAHPVPGAVQGPLYFDSRSGNRAGAPPTVVRLCTAVPPATRPRTTSVPIFLDRKVLADPAEVCGSD